MAIRDNVRKILGELPPGVELVAAVKGRPVTEILEAIEGGVRIIGENYVQEAERAYAVIGKRVSWHFIGHLQRNKVKKVVALFNMLETIDSLELAREVSKRCGQLNRVMPVLVEINSGREARKSGVLPEDAEGLVREISKLENIKVMGLMTIGPFSENPEDSRPYFAETRRIFEHSKSLALPGVEMKYLSMGMTASYRVAVQEGANLVRIGTRIFGESAPLDLKKGALTSR